VIELKLANEQHERLLSDQKRMGEREWLQRLACADKYRRACPYAVSVARFLDKADEDGDLRLSYNEKQKIKRIIKTKGVATDAELRLLDSTGELELEVRVEAAPTSVLTFATGCAAGVHQARHPCTYRSTRCEVSSSG
jgi:hypothetical protein